MRITTLDLIHYSISSHWSIQGQGVIYAVVCVDELVCFWILNHLELFQGPRFNSQLLHFVLIMLVGPNSWIRSHLGEEVVVY